MPTRSNKHVRKFNQLVDVYEPAGVEHLREVESRDQAQLQARLAGVQATREAVADLDAAAFFSERERADIAASESLPAPAAVAGDQREEMLERLELTERALEAALEELSGLEVGGSEKP